MHSLTHTHTHIHSLSACCSLRRSLRRFVFARISRSNGHFAALLMVCFCFRCERESESSDADDDEPRTKHTNTDTTHDNDLYMCVCIIEFAALREWASMIDARIILALYTYVYVCVCFYGKPRNSCLRDAARTVCESLDCVDFSHTHVSLHFTCCLPPG